MSNEVVQPSAMNDHEHSLWYAMDYRNQGLRLYGIPRYDRDELARVLEIAVKEGLPQPRDLDVALDALAEAFRQTPENGFYGYGKQREPYPTGRVDLSQVPGVREAVSGRHDRERATGASTESTERLLRD